jgi:hypothetical protein
MCRGQPRTGYSALPGRSVARCRLVGGCCQAGESMGRPAAWAASSNRQAIAVREPRVATLPRAVEQAYRIAAERDIALTRPEPTHLRRSPEHVVGADI